MTPAKRRRAERRAILYSKAVRGCSCEPEPTWLRGNVVYLKHRGGCAAVRGLPGEVGRRMGVTARL
jgi:hypothetical protein